MADPYFTMLWSDDIPRVRHVDDDGRAVEITLVAGALDGYVPPAPPPTRWSTRTSRCSGRRTSRT
jgi:hypothetical protein